MDALLTPGNRAAMTSVNGGWDVWLRMDKAALPAGTER
jgi:hypothetical protein